MRSSPKLTRNDSGLLGLVVICFALNSIIIRYLVFGSKVSPFPLTVIRFSSGLVALFVISLISSRYRKRETLTVQDVYSSIMLGIYAFSISYGLASIPASAGVMIFYTFVILSMGAYSIVEEGEKLRKSTVAGVILGLIGVFLITFGGIKNVTPLGVALMILTGVTWGIYSAYGRKNKNSFSYTYNSFIIFSLGGLALSLITIPYFGLAVWTTIPLEDLVLTLFMGIVTTAVGYVIWNQLMLKIGSLRGGVVQLLVPVVTAIIAVLLLGEQITLPLVLGGASIVAGIYLTLGIKSRIV